ncbi:Syntaxin 16 [Spironucleus salmonicida]|uniref:Syntaxin 16 n=1 Tax=Spironucleus salmonicida TaxID=348837 RepID=V6M2W7_9EUKA|nr:Syntaxin 16 [Spironucleus salmonicida]|eukprot:EST47609.1 Syntaxin 16 [Spironucleus salmonicida]
MDLTQKFFKFRPAQPEAYEDNAPLIQNQFEAKIPQYIIIYKQLRQIQFEISASLKKIHQKHSQMSSLQFQSAIQEEINQQRYIIVEKLSLFKQKLPTLERLKNTNYESKLIVPQAIISLNVINHQNGQLFRRIQSVYLAELNTAESSISQTNTQGIQQQQQVKNSQDTIYAQQITKEIQDLVQIVSEMTGQVYETGTVIDRIDQHILEADNMVESGIKNLEIARKHQKTISKLRSFTYTLFIIDIIMAILYGIIKI